MTRVPCGWLERTGGGFAGGHRETLLCVLNWPTTMHFLPLILIPLAIILGIYAKRWGLFAEIPVDSEARVGYWASQALAQIKLEWSGSRFKELAEQRVRYSKDGFDCWLWSQHGKLLRQQGTAQAESLGDLGEQGRVCFEHGEDSLRVMVVAQQGELARELHASLPVLP